MGWSVGYDDKWKRDIGYGVPGLCDHPGCGAKIDRGLGYVCGDEPYGGDYGCGLFFCDTHKLWNESVDPEDEDLGEDEIVPLHLCTRCCKNPSEVPFPATPDLPEWIQHKMTHPSWREWREDNPDEVAKYPQYVEVPCVFAGENEEEYPHDWCLAHDDACGPSWSEVTDELD